MMSFDSRDKQRRCRLFSILFVVVEPLTCNTEDAHTKPRDVSVYYDTPPQENEEEGTSYITSTIGMYECQRGYILSGARYIVCFRNGNFATWSRYPPAPTCTRSTGKNLTSCRDVIIFVIIVFILLVICHVIFLEICPKINLPNGAVSYSTEFPTNQTERIGITATFSCNSRYVPYGSHSATCDTDGHWTYPNRTIACICNLPTSSSWDEHSMLRYKSIQLNWRA